MTEPPIPDLAAPENFLVQYARSVATTCHASQRDKAGLPYITHPARVALCVRHMGYDDRYQAAAWLHDVVEDTIVSVEMLRTNYGFPDEVVDAVDALTRRRSEFEGDYYARVLANPIALLVKRCDVADNADVARLAKLDEPTRERLTAKYAAAFVALGLPV